MLFIECYCYTVYSTSNALKAITSSSLLKLLMQLANLLLHILALLATRK